MGILTMVSPFARPGSRSHGVAKARNHVGLKRGVAAVGAAPLGASGTFVPAALLKHPGAKSLQDFCLGQSDLWCWFGDRQ